MKFTAALAVGLICFGLTFYTYISLKNVPHIPSNTIESIQRHLEILTSDQKHHGESVQTLLNGLESLKNTINELKSSARDEAPSMKEQVGDEIKRALEENFNKFNQQNKDVKTQENPADKTIHKRGLEKLSLDLDEVEQLPKPLDSEMNERWIVVTSIFKPTEDIKKLAKIPGWKMVVVGDTKSPKEYKVDNVVFLSIADQENSGFETAKYLTYGCYQRKNMGYLYAIRHGARYIYDTDDDNHPYGGQVVFDEMKQTKSYLMYDGGSERHHYNTFAHFGQSTLWPRGFPLDRIDKDPMRRYKTCSNTRPLVQQGVVDGDPDLDAIQRLTRKDASAKFVVYFDKEAPPVVLPPKSFAPYNSQNTFQHYDIFFALLLPITVTFRVNDIWRSYIAQRLMWDIGGHLAYFPPNAYQDRTPHNFLKDFYEEDDLYRLTNPLTEFLLKWDSKNSNMVERHFEIIKELYKLDILGPRDVRLARAWARDLRRIGYKPPKMQQSQVVCEQESKEFYPKEMPTLMNRIGQKTVNVIEIAKKIQLTKERERDSEK
ncbi:uncharacterized protein [Clytia hemisphaerica]